MIDASLSFERHRHRLLGLAYRMLGSLGSCGPRPHDSSERIRHCLRPSGDAAPLAYYIRRAPKRGLTAA